MHEEDIHNSLTFSKLNRNFRVCTEKNKMSTSKTDLVFNNYYRELVLYGENLPVVIDSQNKKLNLKKSLFT